ncbi:MAG: hypothetical protein KBT40_07860 [bacterium]|nr:hypothetical protein [Candidatus Minthenecus merdequi]
MKKTILICIVGLLSISAYAQKNEFGIVAGGFNGLSYKYYLKPNIAIQTDLACGVERTIVNFPDSRYSVVGTISLWDFSLNPNFLYHKDLEGGLYAFAGGGASLGMLGFFETNIFAGKLGINGMIGAGIKLASVPLSISLDFRPGYGFGFDGSSTVHYFDWHLALGLRYCI